MASKDLKPQQNTFNYASLGRDYGVSLKFNLSASDFVNKEIKNNIITEKRSKTKWKFHFHEANTSKPILYDNVYCWDFDHSFLSPNTLNIDELKSISLSDEYTYAILVNWKEANFHSNDDTDNQNPQSINGQNHSIQSSSLSPQRLKKIHHWRIPLRARLIQQKNDKFVDWITLRSSNSSRASSIGLRTNHYNEKYHPTPSQNRTRNRTDAISQAQAQAMAINGNDKNENVKKATFIGCDYKMDNSELFGVWSLVLITGKRLSFDSPDSSFYVGTKQKSIRKMGGIRASVSGSCLYSIGSDGNGKDSKYCSGKIAKVMIWNGILSKSDIQKLYEHTFNIFDYQKLKTVISKSQKWYSLNNAKYTNKKNVKHRRSLSHSQIAKLAKKGSLTKMNVSSKIAVSVPSSPPNANANTLSSESVLGTPSLIPIKHDRTESVSSINLDNMDSFTRKQIEKQAVINENTDVQTDEGDSSSSSEEEINEIKQADLGKKISIKKVQKSVKNINTNTDETDMDNDNINGSNKPNPTSPPHEKLLDQLEAELLQQQKMAKKEQQKYDENPGILGRFVKSMRSLTQTQNEMNENNDQNVKEVIDIKHKKPTMIHAEEKKENTTEQKVKKEKDDNLKSAENEQENVEKTADKSKQGKGQIRMPPLRDNVEHVVLYETTHRFFLVGSNGECTKYWILKIDRKTTPNSNSSSLGTSPSKKPSSKPRKVTSPPMIKKHDGSHHSNHNNPNYAKAERSKSFSMHDHQQNTRRRPGLHIVEDRTVYNRDQITTILSMIGAGNKSNGGLTQCISGYGIVGFIRFLEGYYIVLITERRKVGMIGHHRVYKIEKTAMIPVTPSTLDSAVSKRLRSDETRYKNLFAVIDLNKEFYFSYSYDLSRTLQWNLCNHFRRKPHHIFVWNEFLLKPLRMATQSNTWMLPIIHGYYESKICSIYGREITLTLISRRSKQFAGTRYLKRGINDLGHSANDIEAEQILHDRVGGDWNEGQFSSHVQMRASIPLFWVQDSNPMVPKPDIYIQKVDPSCVAIRKHFQSVFKRYGAPILVMNLIKHKNNESHARETIVGKEFKRAMAFINSFLPKDYKISYQAWDFKDCQRHKARSVVDELTKFAEWSLQRTGFFHSNPKPQALAAFARRTYDITPDVPDAFVQPVRYENSDECPKEKLANGNQNYYEKSWNTIPESVLLKAFSAPNIAKRRIYDLGCFQKGVMRANCIDSLDRTNVTQFIVGKCALGYQLYAMGIRDTPWLDRESDFIRVLLQMYERMGDCLALQYGGSQMHRHMRNDHAEARSMAPALYKQKEPGNRPREMFVSFVRHYHNNFQDNVKQDAMNLFLGTFRPDPSIDSYKLWELGSDYYLHNRLVTIYKKIPLSLSQTGRKADQWWIHSVLSFNKTFIHCYKQQMLSQQILPPQKTVKLMSNVCKSLTMAIKPSPLHYFQSYSFGLGITNSYLAISKVSSTSNSDKVNDKFFELAFNPSALTIFDDEMKFQSNKIEQISYNAVQHSVHALFYENPNDANSQVEKSKISRITPFLRSKKTKNKMIESKTVKIEMDKDTMNNSDIHQQIDQFAPFLSNISTNSSMIFQHEQGTPSPPPPFNSAKHSRKRTSSYELDWNHEHSLSASVPPPSATSTPRAHNHHHPMHLKQASSMSTLYQDEDMRSLTMPSTTLSSIMQQSTFKYKPQQQKIEKREEKKEESDNNNEPIQTPKQLKHSRQDSYTHILPTPMHFQQMLDNKVPPMPREQNAHKGTEQEVDNDESNADNRRRWKGFFNFFGNPWNMNASLEKNKSDAKNKSEVGTGDNSQSADFHQYGQPDFYYSDDVKEQNELALPKNIFMDKTDFKLFLDESYGKYELTDYVLSTAKCIESKTKEKFVQNVKRITTGNGLYHFDKEDVNGMNECIASRFKECDIGLTEEEFSAFANLHDSYINLDQEIKMIEQDNLKKQQYAFYANLPQNVCNSSLNPKRLNDLNVNDDLLLV